MLVERDNPGRDALILAGPALSGTKHSMTNTPPGSSAPRDIAEAVDPASLAEHGEPRVEDQVHQPERPDHRDLRHVGQGPSWPGEIARSDCLRQRKPGDVTRVG
jgi:hypothetical protein